MIRIERTDSFDKNFQLLVKQLDVDLYNIIGGEQSQFDEYNDIESIRHAVVVYYDGFPVGCGAIREYSVSEMEIKRMFVLKEKRGQGVATVVLKELEKWSKELGYEKCILETGIKQHEATRLYEKNNYKVIPNYGHYVKLLTSVCFEKII